MNLVISHPFRMPTDPSIQTLYMYIGYSDYYTFVKNRRILQFEMLESSNPVIIQRKLQHVFMDQTAYFVCVNDDLLFFDENIRICIEDAYEVIFPKACSFENKSGIKNNTMISRLKCRVPRDSPDSRKIPFVWSHRRIEIFPKMFRNEVNGIGRIRKLPGGDIRGRDNRKKN
jgi:hypothetical protein